MSEVFLPPITERRRFPTESSNAEIEAILNEQVALVRAAGIEKPDVQDLFESRLELHPYALDARSPLNVTFSDEVPDVIAQKLMAQLRRHPTSCLSFDLPPQCPFNHLDKIYIDIKGEITPYKPELSETGLRNRARFRQEMKAFLLEMTGYEDDISDISLREIHRKLRDAKRFLLILTYWKNLFQQATHSAAVLTSSLTPVFEKLERETIFVTARIGNDQKINPYLPNEVSKSHQQSQAISMPSAVRKNGGDLNKWFATTIHGRPVISASEQGLDELRLDETAVIDGLIMFHEALHLVTSELFGSINSETDDEEEEPLYRASLYDVIQEGISLAFELEYAQMLLEESWLNSNERASLKKWVVDREEYLFDAFTLWSGRVRRALVGNKKSLATHESGALSYAEGAHLAHRLRLNGWELNDLPELVSKIEELLHAEGYEPGLDLAIEIPLSRKPVAVPKSEADPKAPLPSYLEIRGKIRHLKPDRLTGE